MSKPDLELAILIDGKVWQIIVSEDVEGMITDHRVNRAMFDDDAPFDRLYELIDDVRAAAEQEVPRA